jgi:1-acyl-sn-glycerol-3-phosphate acyltransferase
MMLRLIVVFAVFALVTLPLMPVQWVAVALRRPLRRRIPVLYHRFLCRLLGIRVRLTGAPIDTRPLLIVANHSSWLDISVITSLAPVVFVAKSEIARWPFFGWLAKLQRSVFVERDRRHKTGAVNAAIAQRLAEGDPVLLFGEGTAGDGNRVLPFRTALIGAAGAALATDAVAGKVWIQPLSIAYVSQQGIPLGRHLRPRAAWYGKMKLVPHIGGIARVGAVDVVVTFGEPIAYDAATDRKELARRLETAIRSLTVAALRAKPLAVAGSA